jgi:pyrroloquinoline quinone biosynthesis protein D
MTDAPRLSRRFRLQYEEAQSRWVLLYPEGMVQLNDSAAEVLRRCDGQRTVEAIVSELELAFAVHGIATQVHDLLNEGAQRGWLD